MKIKINKRFYPFFLILVLTSCSVLNPKNSTTNFYLPSQIQSSNIISDRTQAEAQGSNYAISTQGRYASEAAQKMFSLGGNSIDAFVAASFAISVERPQSTGIGGGGFLIFRDGTTKKVYSVDFRERAPSRAHRDMYLDEHGNYLTQKSKTGVLSGAIPGLVKGLWEVHQKFGKLKWQETLQPAIALAEKGFAVYPDLEKALNLERKNLLLDQSATKIFLKNKKPLKVGDILIQNDLAKTLKRLAKYGANDFYNSSVTESIASKIIAHQKKFNGLITSEDLKNYKVLWREPVTARFLNYQVYSMPPPSSGGIHVIQFLKMLENEKWSVENSQSAKILHIQASALQSAFSDRAQHLGDPDFYPVPQKELISESYLKARRSDISNEQARAQLQVRPGVFNNESSETTHLSIIHKNGDMISSTQTINGYMGSAVVITGTGILLNNEMDDFSAKPGEANLFGAIGGKANEIEPYKTPLSSMSPTVIVDQNNKPIMSVGAPGGTRIISCTAQTIYNHLFFKKSLWDSVTNIRYHHQWSPNILYIEKPGLPVIELAKLKKMGHEVEVVDFGCRVMAVSQTNDTLTAVSDPRDIGISLAK